MKRSGNELLPKPSSSSSPVRRQSSSAPVLRVSTISRPPTCHHTVSDSRMTRCSYTTLRSCVMSINGGRGTCRIWQRMNWQLDGRQASDRSRKRKLPGVVQKFGARSPGALGSLNSPWTQIDVHGFLHANVGQQPAIGVAIMDKALSIGSEIR